MPAVRHPARAGSFYASEAEALRRQVQACFLHSLGPGAVPTASETAPTHLVGLVAPHAGLMYSGPAAAWDYAELARAGRPELVIIAGPNHTGMGHPAAVSAADAWETPLGMVPVSRPDVERLLGHGFVEDESAHRFEHALEVQLPFLQVIYGERVPAIVPIVLGAVGASLRASARALNLEALAEGLAALTLDRSVVIVASSDLSHYVPATTARRQDDKAIAEIVALEPDRLLEVVDENDISMCGALPVALLLQALRGTARSATVLKYYNSGDISGDYAQVVGYAAIAVYAEAGET